MACRDLGREAVARKSRPWEIAPTFPSEQYHRARQTAASLINADPQDMALISSVGYGVAAAAKMLPVPSGSRVLVLQDDHSSPVLEWMTRAQSGEFTVEAVRKPGNGDWTDALLDAIGRANAEPIAIASISSVHWSDGGLVDLAPVAAAIRAQGGALLIDATQSAGVIDLDVRTLDPDFVVFSAYKWLLGPYGRAFLYVARRHQEGVPLEQTSYGRRAVRADQDVYFADLNYVGNAQRFDMGQRDLVSLEIASLGMEMVSNWGTQAIRERLAMLTGRLADGLSGSGVGIPDIGVRAPHILSLEFSGGIPAGLLKGLAAENIFVARRLGRLRVSPFVYNDEDDIDRLLEAFRELLPA
ncbi:hypothetical protein ASD44_15775 [Mesorhizobium sp. Root554]|nr:hypothetical protein ASD27_15780 [Mesorhizobium sp. Root1471]KQZ37864.1 hypothetical protein ASD44_15775 [Mesorhizobium sp. Root554]